MVKYLVIVQICEALRTVLLQTHQNCPYIHDKLNQNSLAHLPYSMLPYKSFNTNRMSSNLAMEKGPLISDFPIKTSIQFRDFPASYVWLPESIPCDLFMVFYTNRMSYTIPWITWIVTMNHHESIYRGFIECQWMSYTEYILTGWWCHPLWRIWKSIGMTIPTIWKHKKIFQTTNQYMSTPD